MTALRRLLTLFGGMAGLLVFAWWTTPTTEAQPSGSIQVTAAEPAEAPQETLGLEVTISGNNFPTDPTVEFLVTGTSDPGGITVRSVTRRSPKSLKAVIDISSEAALAKFDIQVRSVGNGRTGKGTELFRVLQKSGGGANQAPGAVLDLAVTSVGPTTVVVTFTETADNGYDPASGSVDRYLFRYRLDGPVASDGYYTSNNIYNGGLWGETPGAAASLELASLDPDQTYYIAVFAQDEAGNLSSASNNVVVTTSPFPATPWVRTPLNVCNGTSAPFAALSFSTAHRGDGAPIVAFKDECNGQGSVLAEWNGSTFVFENLGFLLNDSNHFLAIDPSTGDPTMTGATGDDIQFFRKNGQAWVGEVIDRRKQPRAGSLAYDGSGLPAVFYAKSLKGSILECRVARRQSGGWSTESVASPCGGGHLAFDAAGAPALTFIVRTDNPGLHGLPVYAYDDGGGWRQEIVEPVPLEFSVTRPHLAVDPVMGESSLAYLLWSGPTNEPTLLRFCHRSDNGWTCETVEESSTGGMPALAYDRFGTAYLAYESQGLLKLATRAPGSTWTIETIDWVGRAAVQVSIAVASTAGGSTDVTVAYLFHRDDNTVKAFGVARKTTP